MAHVIKVDFEQLLSQCLKNGIFEYNTKSAVSFIQSDGLGIGNMAMWTDGTILDHE
jgi:hypothetical protein